MTKIILLLSALLSSSMTLAYTRLAITGYGFDKENIETNEITCLEKYDELYKLRKCSFKGQQLVNGEELMSFRDMDFELRISLIESEMIQNKIRDLKNFIDELERFNKESESSFAIPLHMDTAHGFALVASSFRYHTFRGWHLIDVEKDELDETAFLKKEVHVAKIEMTNDEFVKGVTNDLGENTVEHTLVITDQDDYEDFSKIKKEALCIKIGPRKVFSYCEVDESGNIVGETQLGKAEGYSHMDMLALRNEIEREISRENSVILKDAGWGAVVGVLFAVGYAIEIRQFKLNVSGLSPAKAQAALKAYSREQNIKRLQFLGIATGAFTFIGFDFGLIHWLLNIALFADGRELLDNLEFLEENFDTRKSESGNFFVFVDEDIEETAENLSRSFDLLNND